MQNKITGTVEFLPDQEMTLRDWFAGIALQGIIAGAGVNADRIGDRAFGNGAHNAYRFADAMLEARKK